MLLRSAESAAPDPRDVHHHAGDANAVSQTVRPAAQRRGARYRRNREMTAIPGSA